MLFQPSYALGAPCSCKDIGPETAVYAGQLTAGVVSYGLCLYSQAIQWRARPGCDLRKLSSSVLIVLP
jgi:hypothetical protein